MKKKKNPGVFFTDPADGELSKGSKETIKTFVEGENEPAGTHYHSEDYRRIIDVSFDQTQEKKKKKKG